MIRKKKSREGVFMSLSEEMIEKKAKEAKSAEDLLNIAKESGAEITLEEAQQIFDEIKKPADVSDDELDTITGGAGEALIRESKKNGAVCSKCGADLEVEIKKAFLGFSSKKSVCKVCGKTVSSLFRG